MNIESVPLNSEYLDRLLKDAAPALLTAQLHRAYFSAGSEACCILSDGVPVFAGGIVNLQWNRGEAWFLPTPFLREHLKTCLRYMRFWLPDLAKRNKFVRVQATCVKGIKSSIIKRLGFSFEGTLMKFGPAGETCDMYSRIFEVEQ